MSKSLIGVAIESTEYMHVCKYIFFSIAARSVSGCSDEDDDCPNSLVRYKEGFLNNVKLNINLNNVKLSNVKVLSLPHKATFHLWKIPYP